MFYNKHALLRQCILEKIPLQWVRGVYLHPCLAPLKKENGIDQTENVKRLKIDVFKKLKCLIKRWENIEY